LFNFEELILKKNKIFPNIQDNASINFLPKKNLKFFEKNIIFACLKNNIISAELAIHSTRVV
jgi:hypothetical protein